MKFIISGDKLPPSRLVAISRQLQQLPQPMHRVGDIVVVPPAVYGVIRFACPNLEHCPPRGWVYGVATEEDWERFNYFPEDSIVPVPVN